MLAPFHLQSWIDSNRALLKPPVGNKQLFYHGDFIVMVVGGPNARTDYHYNEGSELFYQLEGDITVNIQLEGTKQSIHIKEGEMFMLPSKVPHMPLRGENTVGLVIEHKRRSEDLDGLLWFCETCNNKLYEEYFPLESIENDFIPIFKKFNQSEELRTCKNCGTVATVDTRFI